MVHQYQLNGYNIVLDTCSGSVHVVDDVAYDAIAMYKEHSADEIVAALLAKYGSRPDVTEADLRQCLEDVASLESAGKLWAPDVYENMAFDFKNRQTVVKALCLHVAHTCNLNCSYCFASQGGYRLTKAPADYTAGEILRAIEGSVAPIPCLGSETNECPMWEQCFTLPFWTGLDEVINQYIDSVTLEQLSSQLPASDKKEGCCSCGTKNA